MSFKIQLVAILILIAGAISARAQNLLNNPESAVYDSLHHCHLVSNWGTGAIVRIDSSGAQSYFSTELMGQYRLAGLYVYGDTLLAAAGDAPNAGIMGFDLETAALLYSIILPGVGLPNDITSDASGVLYVTDYWGDKLYKIVNRSPSVFVSQGLDYPNGIAYDPRYDRLLVCSVMGPGAPILAVNLDDSSVSTVVATGFDGTDGITLDEDFNVYVSEWTGDALHKYDSTFSSGPELFSSGHDDPADIYYDRVNDLLAVPNFSSHTVDFVPVSAPAVDETKKSDLLREFRLFQNYPNPFNPTTRLAFALPQAAPVSLSIYDLSGRRVADTLVGAWCPPGIHQAVFDGSNLSSGMYIYQLKAGSGHRRMTASGTMILLQ